MWVCEKFMSDADEEVWRVFDDSDSSYEATICELWSAEHVNESLAQQICSNANLIEQQAKQIETLKVLRDLLSESVIATRTSDGLYRITIGVENSEKMISLFDALDSIADSHCPVGKEG